MGAGAGWRRAKGATGTSVIVSTIEERVYKNNNLKKKGRRLSEKI